MRARAVVAAVLACLVAATVADAARSPRLERLALRAGDTTLARNAMLRRADLPAGWSQATGADSEDAPPCNWNLSRFTITGRSGATFTRSGQAIYAEVDVFPTAAQAQGDYGIQVDPKSLACEGEYLRTSFGSATKLVSARVLASPGLGDRSAARRWTFDANGTTVTVDLLALVRGRANVGLFALSRTGAIPGTAELLRRVDQRLRAATA